MQNEIIHFWFSELDPQQWWKKDKTFDLMIEKRFGVLHKQAQLGELNHWRKTAEGSLAEIIILDQFSRNIYREQPESFTNDPLALALSQHAIAKRFDLELSETKRVFMYMPYMHSESALIHCEALKLYTALGNANTLAFELKHKAIIDKFNRYPHRNKILGRVSTPDEIAFLKQENSSF
ncbi:DUF924 family protein [Algibacillus agarilyticus]|uniref:DUF924 family protein n=1 Tax=Algibacillus agarilyticus TaxID=2234133 RepID=UPI000DD08B2B|nr:DUF924 family protein [Algibacillus agarilyticus]